MPPSAMRTSSAAAVVPLGDVTFWRSVAGASGEQPPAGRQGVLQPGGCEDDQLVARREHCCDLLIEAGFSLGREQDAARGCSA